MKECAAMQHKATYDYAACNDALIVVGGKTAVLYVLETDLTKVC